LNARELAPDHAGILYNCGTLAQAAGNIGQAIDDFEGSIHANPNYAPAYSNLGMALRRQGRLADAEVALRNAVRLAPDLFEAHLNLGGILSLTQGDPEEGRAVCGRALALNPSSPEGHYNMGNALARVPDYTAALHHYEQATGLHSRYDEAFNNKANALMALGRIDEAYSSMKEAVRIDPSYPAWHSNLVFHRHYDASESPQSLFEAARQWDEVFAPPGLTACGVDDRNPDRPLSIGLVGAHFARHPVGYFLQPVLPMIDSSRMKVTCYANQVTSDDFTERLSASAAVWQPVANESDATLLDRIRADKVDILVDLDGHTSANRLAVFAHRAAPIQVTWAGYVGTTGVTAMDYLITDQRETPDSDLPFMTEQPVYMPGNYVTISPLEDAPTVKRVRDADGGITFGCFNNLNKINDRVLALWSDVLSGVPSSRLCLITEHLADANVTRRITEAFAAHGIAAERLDLRGKLPREDLLEAYNTIDIALDPFPYSGGLTTLEALWMGTPVITRGDGDRFAQRHSVTHLTAVGVPELIADDAEDYVARAVALAGDAERRQNYHATLREQMRNSPACDGAGFTRNLEKAFRIMWQRACAGEAPALITEDQIAAG